jgi:hypothetical protein
MAHRKPATAEDLARLDDLQSRVTLDGYSSRKLREATYGGERDQFDGNEDLSKVLDTASQVRRVLRGDE